MTLTISLGSNTPDCRERLSRAYAWLSTLCTVKAYSGPYLSEPEGERARRHGACYLNAVAVIESDLGAADFQRLAKEYEFSEGRDGECRRCGTVPIDIDVVLAGDAVLRQRDFTSLYFRRGLALLPQGR